MFYAWEVIDTEIYEQLCFFSYMNVDVVHFAMDLVIMIHYKKYTCLQPIQLFHLCVLYTQVHI
jgi:hypothetical protein